MGKEVGVERVAVSNWERGVYAPTGENLVALADAFGVSVEYLVHGEGGRYRAAFEDIAAIVDRVRAAAAPTVPPGDSSVVAARLAARAAGKRQQQEGEGEPPTTGEAEEGGGG